MAYQAGLHWSTPPSRMAANATAMRDALIAAIKAFALDLARAAEREAKANAPWRDRTGQARARLRGFVEQSGLGRFRVLLAHGVPYGIWLEVKHAGRWGIVMRTLERMAPVWRGFLASLGF